MELTFKNTVRLKAPMMPNFILIEQEAGKEGIQCVHVGDLKEEEAKAYAEWMKELFLQHWKTKKGEPKLATDELAQ